MFTFDQTKAGYGHLWDAAKLYSPKVDATADAAREAKRIVALKSTFQEVEQATSVPWWMVGCLLYREADLSTNAYLGNGQSLHKVTTEVPAGRGPFATFLDGAVDAIHHEGFPKGARWTIELALYWMERFNGQGYYTLNCNSPYLWNWTDQYHGGKFTADHHFDHNEWDVQGGCAALVKELVQLDTSIELLREGATPVLKPPAPAPLPVPLPSGPVSTDDPIAFLRQFLLDAAGISNTVAAFKTDISNQLTGVVAKVQAFNIAQWPATQSAAPVFTPISTPKGQNMPTPSTPAPPLPLIHWQTSLAGVVAIIPTVLDLVTSWSSKNWSQVGVDIGIIAGGLGLVAAKDANK